MLKQVIGVISAIVAVITLLYIISGFLNNYPMENILLASTAFLVSVGIAGLCLYTGKPKK